MAWIDAIYDRTQFDVERVNFLSDKWTKGTITNDEKTEWVSDLKGALNLSDLNRIQNNIQLLSDVLELSLVVDTVTDFPNVTFFQNLLSNVESIRSAYSVHYDTPSTPVAPVNQYVKINNIEKILKDVYDILGNNFFYYSGEEIYCGDSIGLVL